MVCFLVSILLPIFIICRILVIALFDIYTSKRKKHVFFVPFFSSAYAISRNIKENSKALHPKHDFSLHPPSLSLSLSRSLWFTGAIFIYFSLFSSILPLLTRVLFYAFICILTCKINPTSFLSFFFKKYLFFTYFLFPIIITPYFILFFFRCFFSLICILIHLFLLGKYLLFCIHSSLLFFQLFFFCIILFVLPFFLSLFGFVYLFIYLWTSFLHSFT